MSLAMLAASATICAWADPSTVASTCVTDCCTSETASCSSVTASSSAVKSALRSLMTSASVGPLSPPKKASSTSKVPKATVDHPAAAFSQPRLEKAPVFSSPSSPELTPSAAVDAVLAQFPLVAVAWATWARPSRRCRWSRWRVTPPWRAASARKARPSNQVSDRASSHCRSSVGDRSSRLRTRWRARRSDPRCPATSVVTGVTHSSPGAR